MECAHDTAAAGVEHDGEEHDGEEEESLPGGRVRRIGDPELVRRGGDTRPLDESGCGWTLGITAGRDDASSVTASHPRHPHAARHPLA
jgi:hypothetical protein